VRVIFTPRAVRQIGSLHDYIASRAGVARADAFVGRIVTYCRGLGTFPARGAKRDDLLPGLRTISFERRATIAFVTMPDRVVIEGVFYGGQDFERVLRGD
jgi:toxin ParE1/3/4